MKSWEMLKTECVQAGTILGIVLLLPYASTGADELRVGRLPANRILVLGNSITLHGPKANIDWHGNWGMAASSEKNDFVHLLADSIAKKAGGTPQLRVVNIAEFERNFRTFDIAAKLHDEIVFGADIIVLAIGDNVPDLPDAKAEADFAQAFRGLVQLLTEKGGASIFVRSSYYPKPAVDQVMKHVTTATARHRFIDVSDLFADPSTHAHSERKYSNAAVGDHPGDKGMRIIATRLFDSIVEQATPPPR